ncbi:MAG: manganese efflux pump MntP family protein [Bacteroidota bacterium]
MSLLETILIGIGLAMDCFAVSVSCSIIDKKIRLAQALIIALFFGLFQGAMPVIGWLLGLSFKEYITEFDHWIAFGILGAIGIKMIVESFKKENKKQIQLSKTWVLISLSIATSIDALIVGVSLAFLDVNIIKVVVIIGTITFLISILGLRLGKRIGLIRGNMAELIGGLVLIGIGTKILIEHLTH